MSDGWDDDDMAVNLGVIENEFFCVYPQPEDGYREDTKRIHIYRVGFARTTGVLCLYSGLVKDYVEWICERFRARALGINLYDNI